MFPNNAAAAKRLGKRRMREVAGETTPVAATFNFQGHHLASTSHAPTDGPFNFQGHHLASTSHAPADGHRSQVQKVLNNAAAAAATPLKPFSFMALLTGDNDIENNEEEEDDYEFCPMSNDINQMIEIHNENLRQSVAGMLEKHKHSHHHAAEERAAKRLREQNEELERLVELYRGESERLLARVRYLERTAMTLSEGLQEAHAARQYAEAEEEEAESSFEDPDRVGPVRLDCKVCERQLATVMVWPCRHVCVCKSCDAATKRCPVCRCIKTTSVELCLPLD